MNDLRDPAALAILPYTALGAKFRLIAKKSFASEALAIVWARSLHAHYLWDYANRDLLPGSNL